MKYLATFYEDGWQYELCYENGDTDKGTLPGKFGTANDALYFAAGMFGIQIEEAEVGEEFGHEAAVYYF